MRSLRGVCGVSAWCRDCIVGALGLATVVCVCLLSDTWFSMLDVISLALMPRHPCRHVNRHTAARRRGTTPGMGGMSRLHQLGGKGKSKSSQRSECKGPEKHKKNEKKKKQKKRKVKETQLKNKKKRKKTSKGSQLSLKDEILALGLVVSVLFVLSRELSQGKSCWAVVEGACNVWDGKGLL